MPVKSSVAGRFHDDGMECRRETRMKVGERFVTEQVGTSALRRTPSFTQQVGISALQQPTSVTPAQAGRPKARHPDGKSLLSGMERVAKRKK